jgi:hypothetical protein
MTVALVDILTASTRKTGAKGSIELTTKTVRESAFCFCFQMLNFGIICYTALDNKCSSFLAKHTYRLLILRREGEGKDQEAINRHRHLYPPYRTTV